MRRLAAFAGAMILCAALTGCVAGGKKKSARKPAPTPAERLALKHYKLGIDSYANDKYAEAISHWKVTLANDPENPNAKDYIGRAENMLKAVKGAKVPTPRVTPKPGLP